MKRPVLILVALGALFAPLCPLGPTLSGQAPQEDIKSLLEANAIIQQKVMVPMRDGVRMAADVYRPKGDGPFPVIFSRTAWLIGIRRLLQMSNA